MSCYKFQRRSPVPWGVWNDGGGPDVRCADPRGRVRLPFSLQHLAKQRDSSSAIRTKATTKSYSQTICSPFSHMPVPITDTSQCTLSHHHDNADPAQAARRLSTKECRVSSWGLISNDDLGSQRRLACDIGEPAIRALCTQDCLDSPLQYPIKGKIT